MVIFLGAEAMVFAGLLSAFGVYRLSSPVWPPLGEPRLPAGVTALNTAVLLASAVAMHRARLRAGRGDSRSARRALAVAAGLGAAFLIVQGGEWTAMLHRGLTVVASPYGGIFSALIGVHGAHVAAAVVALVATAWGGRVDARRLEPVALYWHFVVGVWIVVFPLVYLG
jgi:cytochrome c oxidase subunit 3